MRTCLFLLTLPVVLLGIWAWRPIASEQPVDQPVLPAMPRIEDDKASAHAVSLRIEEPGTAYAGLPCTLTLHLKNPTTKVVKNLLLSASFDQGLEHETKARPVELTVPELKAGETKDIPLILTPKQAWEFGVQVSLTYENGMHTESVAKVKATMPSPTPTPRADAIQRIPTLSFGQAETHAGAIKVSFMGMYYEPRMWSPNGEDVASRATYYALVTYESEI